MVELTHDRIIYTHDVIGVMHDKKDKRSFFFKHKHIHSLTHTELTEVRHQRLSLFTIFKINVIHYDPRGSRIFPRQRDGVLIPSAIHRRGIVIAGPRVYRDGVRYSDSITNVRLWYKLNRRKIMKSNLLKIR